MLANKFIVQRPSVGKLKIKYELKIWSIHKDPSHLHQSNAKNNELKDTIVYALHWIKGILNIFFRSYITLATSQALYFSMDPPAFVLFLKPIFSQ